MKFGPIYKLTKNGKVQTWEIHVEDNAFYTIEGLLNGKLTRSAPTFCVAKNVGRSNETTPEEQALREAESRYTRKCEKGYTPDVTAVEETKQDGYEPMTALKFKDRVKKDNITECYVQPKLDGIRCILMKSGAYTRNGKPIVSIPHIQVAFEAFFEEYPHAIVDGELYNHELHNDFNKITSIIKKTKPKPEHLEESKRLAQYHVYDMPRLTKVFAEDMTFSQRYKKMVSVLNEKVYLDFHKYLRFVPSYFISAEEYSVEKLQQIHDEFVQEGYEGLMVRLDKPYEQKRSKSLLKYKVFDDDEFIVDDILIGRGKKATMAAKIVLHTHDGVSFEAGINGTDEYCTQVLKDKNKYIGKPAKVRYFGYTPGDEAKPRFAKVLELNRTDNI